MISLLITALALLPNPLKTRVEISLHNDIFGLSRTGIWESAFHIFSDHPFGIGPSMFKYYFAQYNFPIEGAMARFGRHANTAHNEYLQFIAEMGIQGIILLVLAILFFVKQIKTILISSFGKKGNGFETGILSAIFLIALHCAVDSSLHDYTIGITTAVLLGIAVGNSERIAPAKKMQLQVSPLFPWVISFPLLIFFVLSLMLGAGQFYKEKGITFIKNADYLNSEEQFKKSLFIVPFDSETFNARANLWFNKFIETEDTKYLQSSFSDESSALSLNSLNSLFYYHSGMILLNFKAKDNSSYYISKALDFFQKAKGLNPFNPFYRHEIISIYLKTGKINLAEKEAKELLKIEPNFIPALEALYWIYEKTPETNKSEKIINAIKDKLKYFQTTPELSEYEKSFLKLSDEIKGKILQSSANR